MSYVAIETKYIGPTNYRGSRIKAWEREGRGRDDKPRSVTVSYDSALATDTMHEKAAYALLDKIAQEYHAITGLELPGRKLIAGGTEKGYVFLRTD